jgi:hypothetical protein
MKIYCFIIILVILISACRKNETSSQLRIYGTWVRQGDVPGKAPADTLIFYKQNNQNLLKFYLGNGSPGSGFPSEVITDFKLEGSKIFYKDYLSPQAEFREIKSFQWTDDTHFNLKFYELVVYISADYRVYYEKVQ